MRKCFPLTKAWFLNLLNTGEGGNCIISGSYWIHARNKLPLLFYVNNLVLELALSR
jgi:hypothetical protein